MFDGFSAILRTDFHTKSKKAHKSLRNVDAVTVLVVCLSSDIFYLFQVS